MISDLPCELETEILSRVPPKSVAKLQTTCKRWYVLFKDPKFVMKNSDKAAKEVILHKDFMLHSMNLGAHQGPLMKSTSKIRCLKDLEDVKISEIYHCDGLVLLCSTEKNKRLVVWNPCTGETKSIKPRNCYTDNDVYGFGYGKSESSSGRSYKILRSTRFRNDQHSISVYCEMYEFSSDSWRVLGDRTNKDWGRFPEVSMKGNTYYIAREGGGLFCIRRFDFTTERFVAFTLPHESGPQDRASLSVVREEELAVLLYEFDAFPRQMKVWLSSKIDDAKEVSWTKFLVEDSKFWLPEYFEGMSFTVDEKNKVVVCCSRGMEGGELIYGFGEDFLRQVYKDRICFSWLRPCLLIYAPSLAQIPKSEEEEKRGG